MGFSGFLPFYSRYCKCTRFCVDVSFLTVNVYVFVGFFLCAYQSNFIRFGFAVLIMVSLKRSSTRIARVVFPFSLLRIYGTNE